MSAGRSVIRHRGEFEGVILWFRRNPQFGITHVSAWSIIRTVCSAALLSWLLVQLVCVVCAAGGGVLSHTKTVAFAAPRCEGLNPRVLNVTSDLPGIPEGCGRASAGLRYP